MDWYWKTVVDKELTDHCISNQTRLSGLVHYNLVTYYSISFYSLCKLSSFLHLIKSM